MVISVDTNIFLDVLTSDEEHVDSSLSFLLQGMKQGSLVVCEMVYAELCIFFKDRNTLESFLSDFNIYLKVSNEQSLFAASKAWKKYLKNRGKSIQCTTCGNKMNLSCDKCGNSLQRKHIISDFIIGAHAQELCDTLITRDRGIYKNYYKDLVLNYGT